MLALKRIPLWLKKKFPSAPLCSWREGEEYGSQDYILTMEKGEGDFVILNLADIQLRFSEILQDADCVGRAEKTIRKLIKKVKPSLLTLTGDQGFGSKTEILTVGRMLDRFGIAWAPVLGNADNRSDKGLSVAEQAYLYENAFQHCVFRSGALLGTLENGQPRSGNYILNVVERKGEELVPVRSLIFMNSGDEQTYREEDFLGQRRANADNYSRLTETQKKWLLWAVKGVQKNRNVPCSLFLHIPIFAYNKTTEGTVLFGDRREQLGTPPYEDFVAEMLLEEGHTDSVFCGHDHRNDDCLLYKGLSLCYTLKTGSGCYYDKDKTGGTVITVNREKINIRQEYCPVKGYSVPRWLYFLIGLAAVAVLLGIFL